MTSSGWQSDNQAEGSVASETGAPQTIVSSATIVKTGAGAMSAYDSSQQELAVPCPIPERVTVTGPIVDWPMMCPCCLGMANARMDTSHTTLSDGEAPRSLVHSCAVPYCNTCLNHVQTAQRIQALESRVGTASDRLYLVGTGGLVSLGILLVMIHSPFLLVMAALPAVLLALGKRASINEKLDVDRERYGLLQQGLSEMKPTCCSLGPAVELVDYEGGVSTFALSHPHYTAEFRQHNAHRVRKDGQAVIEHTMR